MNTKSLFQRISLADYALLSLLLVTLLGPAQAQTELARERVIFTVVEQ